MRVVSVVCVACCSVYCAVYVCSVCSVCSVVCMCVVCMCVCCVCVAGVCVLSRAGGVQENKNPTLRMLGIILCHQKIIMMSYVKSFSQGEEEGPARRSIN